MQCQPLTTNPNKNRKQVLLIRSKPVLSPYDTPSHTTPHSLRLHRPRASQPPLPHQRRHRLLRGPPPRGPSRHPRLTNQPHIQPWHAAIAAAFSEHREGDTQQALSALPLRDVTRILTSKPTPTLRIRAVNAIIRLANAMKRANPSRREGQGWVHSAHDNPKPDASAQSHVPAHSPSSPSRRAAKELHHAQERAPTNLRLLPQPPPRIRRAEIKKRPRKTPKPPWAQSHRGPAPTPPHPITIWAVEGRGEVGERPQRTHPRRNRRPSPLNRKSQITNRKSLHTAAIPTPRATPLNRKSQIKNRKSPHPLPRLPHPPSPQTPPPAAATSRAP